MNGVPGGVGDIYPKFEDPLETIYDIYSQGRKLPRRRWIVRPDWQPCEVRVPPGPHQELVKRMVDAQRMDFECNTLPRAWQLLMDFLIKLRCGTYFVKDPNWLQPPVTARPVEIVNETDVDIPNTGVETIIAQFEVPDRWVGTILTFGHGLADPVEWNNVIWNIRVNDAPAPGYQDFIKQRGDTLRPTPLASMINLKHEDVVTITARKTGGAATVGACVRAQGFIFPATELSQDGSFVQYHTL